MPVFEQGYRPYTGELRRGSRAIAIAWESLRPRMRWWVWLLVAFQLVFSPYTLFGALTFAVLMAGVAQPPAAAGGNEVAFAMNVDPTRFVGAVLGGSGAYFWEAIAAEFMIGAPVILVAVACSGLLASDRRTGALQIYFARPVARADYLLGKSLVVVAFTALLTAVPAVLLWCECAALHPKVEYVAATWWVPLASVAASALYAFWIAAFVLALSSLLQRPVLIGTLAIFSFFALHGFAELLAEVLEDLRWRALSPHYALGGVTSVFFGLERPEWLPLHLCAGHAVVLPALCGLVIVRRLRAVEVVT